MSNIVSEIKTAIDSFDMERARELLREALKQNPSADVYYLASLAAVNEKQKKSFLEKAIELDPFHKEANSELNKSTKSFSSPKQTELPASPPSMANSPSVSKNQNATSFSMGNTLLIAALGFGGVGIIYSLKWLLFIPYTTGTNALWFNWFTDPVGDFISGVIIAFALGQLIPAIKTKGAQIGFGFVIGSLLNLTIGRAIYDGLPSSTNGFISSLVYNLFWVIVIPIVLRSIIGKIVSGIEGKVFGYWILSTIIAVIFWAITPDFNLFKYPSEILPYTISNMIGVVIFGVLGCYLTLNELQKILQNPTTSI